LTVVETAVRDRKAEDVVILDVASRTILADAFVIATGRSKIQTRAVADAVAEAARENGHAVARTEGYHDGTWILVDLGTVIVHVFTPDMRQFYNLERLWSTGEAREIRQTS